MGLVTCEKCNKIYDYDKYNGICPKCARYNRESTSAQEHQDYHNKYDGGYSHNAQDDHHSYHQRYDDNRNPHGSQLEGVQETLRDVMGAEHKVNLEVKKSGKMDKKTKKILGIFIGLILLMFLMPFFGPFLFVVAFWAILVILKGKKKK
ncbi:MAG: hypothetical protein IJ420_01325 [Lachnospiraceae bacterium]|nr:hypothetical protein [Lachnospiraceae bacterium]